MSETTREIVLKDMTESADQMGLDLEDLLEMMEDVLEDCTEKVTALIQAGEDKNTTQIKEIAHDLKGCTANYGLLNASSIAKEIEQDYEVVPIKKIEALKNEIALLSGLNLDNE